MKKRKERCIPRNNNGEKIFRENSANKRVFFPHLAGFSIYCPRSRTNRNRGIVCVFVHPRVNDLHLKYSERPFNPRFATSAERRVTSSLRWDFENNSPTRHADVPFRKIIAENTVWKIMAKKKKEKILRWHTSTFLLQSLKSSLSSWMFRAVAGQKRAARTMGEGQSDPTPQSRPYDRVKASVYRQVSSGDYGWPMDTLTR
ncbi:hypothetical protein ALC56_07704 [Trachymyrmex septentrionalis]|uniref:Uncharacterized protein n=1 Tax=Trachymyrmex septentrionalis TaxID=34720 RepID=A0A151JVN3_9HYME|nr:hypothetical protein ALC56_07704 [Trachymyrmex septentrionalis]